ncbi:hypothetical protein SpCBS45565_g06726 [Spizellomyces sp. 'palustris']|nr:hypothetical protein SpCBS45565_g06726 [Spizellomyces sp. 'palustris']
MNTVDGWAQDRLSALMGLGGEELQQITAYLLQITSPEAVVEFLTGMLGDAPPAVQFIQEFNTRRFPPVVTKGAWRAPLKTADVQASTPVNGSPTQAKKNFKDEQNVYRKPDTEEDYFKGTRGSKTSSALSPNPPSRPLEGELLSDKLSPLKIDDRSTQASKYKQKKGKKERMNVAAVAATLDSLDGMVKVGSAPPGFGGRVVCECLAATHGLITNCLTCGKVICRLEGEGPCPCCGTPVYSKQQQVTLVQERKTKGVPTRSSKVGRGRDAYVGARYGQAAGAQVPSAASIAKTPNGADQSQFPTLMTEKDQEVLARAEAQMEKLLDFQRNSTARTRVHDQASDFNYDDDASNKWLSAEERALALKKAQEQRRLEEEQKRRRVITLDLVNKRVIDSTPKPPSPQVHKTEAQPSRPASPPQDPGSSGQFRNPTLKTAPPVYVPVKPGTVERAGKIPIQRRAAEARLSKDEQMDADSAKGEQYTAGPRPRRKPRSKATSKKNRWKPQLSRIQHDMEGGDGWTQELRGEFEFDEYAAEGGGGYADEPECG